MKPACNGVICVADEDGSRLCFMQRKLRFILCASCKVPHKIQHYFAATTDRFATNPTAAERFNSNCGRAAIWALVFGAFQMDFYIFFRVFNFLLLKSTNFLCIVKVDTGIAYPLLFFVVIKQQVQFRSFSIPTFCFSEFSA